MSFKSSGALNHRNWNLKLGDTGASGPPLGPLDYSNVVFWAPMTPSNADQYSPPDTLTIQSASGGTLALSGNGSVFGIGLGGNGNSYYDYFGTKTESVSYPTTTNIAVSVSMDLTSFLETGSYNAGAYQNFLVVDAATTNTYHFAYTQTAIGVVNIYAIDPSAGGTFTLVGSNISGKHTYTIRRVNTNWEFAIDGVILRTVARLSPASNAHLYCGIATSASSLYSHPSAITMRDLIFTHS